MPLYEYLCRDCRVRHDIRHGFDETAGPCPACGGVLERVFHVGGIHFKGSGFYTTDYKRSNPAAGPSASNGSSDSASAKSDGAAAKSVAPAKSDTAAPAPASKAAEKSA
ncbi:hypothetical protein EPN52_14785 [bacterium]|nr:MAG: hypothetical protein EPN52_14785 [bacterium]